MFRLPFTGISLDNEVLSLDVTEPTKLLEQRSPGRNAPGLSEFGHRVRRVDNRDVVDLLRLLRVSAKRPRNRHATGQRDELPPPHPEGHGGGKSAFDVALPGSGHGAAFSAGLYTRLAEPLTGVNDVLTCDGLPAGVPLISFCSTRAPN